MKICVLGEFFYPDSTGGSGTVLSKLIRQLKDANPDLEIDVITSRNLFRGAQNSLPAQEDWNGVRIARLPSRIAPKHSMKRRLSANLVFTYRTLKRLLRTGSKYDLVLVVTAPPTLPLAAKAFSSLTGTPYVYLVYDLYLDMALAMNLIPSDGRLARVCYRVQNGWFAKARHSVVLGRCMAGHLRRVYGVPDEKISVIPIPANSIGITPLSKDTQFRRENEIEGFVVLYAGNFARYQDFDLLLDAASLLRDRQDISLIFVGDGAKKEYILEKITAQNLNNVRVLSFVPEEQLADLLASADASLVTLEKGVKGLAVPSKFYNILASGRPTLACVPEDCEVARVVEETGAGLTIDQNSAQHLADKIRFLADNPDVAAQMGVRARQICEERYGLDVVAAQFYALFEKLTRTPQKLHSPDSKAHPHFSAES